MRLFVLTATVLGLLAPAASACPPIEACVFKLPSTVREVRPTPDAPSPVTAAMIKAIRAPLPARLAPGEVEMPWIWRSLRDRVYSRMPTYKDQDDIKIVFAPVVVTSPSDTVPGLGIAGDF